MRRTQGRNNPEKRWDRRKGVCLTAADTVDLPSERTPHLRLHCRAAYGDRRAEPSDNPDPGAAALPLAPAAAHFSSCSLERVHTEGLHALLQRNCLL
uniref:Uncharacterized protein n=1 Tax=Knipowitschia caucasica TaxID=637954 RepID=A0AAV2J1H5_KNICA